MRTSILATLAVAATAAPSYAQTLDLTKVGGGLGGTLSCPIQGEPNEPLSLIHI